MADIVFLRCVAFFGPLPLFLIEIWRLQPSVAKNYWQLPENMCKARKLLVALCPTWHNPFVDFNSFSFGDFKRNASHICLKAGLWQHPQPEKDKQ